MTFRLWRYLYFTIDLVKCQLLDKYEAKKIRCDGLQSHLPLWNPGVSASTKKSETPCAARFESPGVKNLILNPTTYDFIISNAGALGGLAFQVGSNPSNHL